MNNINKKLLTLLGAPDPEMFRIEQVCKLFGIPIIYARKGNQRVNPSQAKDSDPIEITNDYYEIIQVECRVPLKFKSYFSLPKIVTIDHHEPGDPGSEYGPSEFVRGSSLGQFLLHLSEMFTFNKLADVGFVLIPDLSFSQPLVFYNDCWLIRDKSKNYYRICDDFKFAMAADHCLGAAYRGECPGVEPDQLMNWRLQIRSEFQKVPVTDLISKVRFAISKIKSAPIIGPNIRDLRGEVIPELPEAGARVGEAILAGPLEEKGKAGLKKYVLQFANKEQIDYFLAMGFQNPYFNYERGFAGGYLKE
jgi:hypothetical protein